MTLWGAGEILTNFFAGGKTLPEDFWLALVKDAAPSAFISGAELDEPQVGSYNRMKIPASAAYWDNAGQMHVIGTTKNLPFVTANQDWGSIRYWALCDARVEGHIYAIGDLEPIYVATGEAPELFAGDLTIALGPFYQTQEG